MTLVLVSCDNMSGLVSYTTFKYHDYHKGKIDMPHGGVLLFELSPSTWSEENSDGKKIKINKGPYTLKMFFQYDKEKSGVVKLINLLISQENYKNKRRYSGLPGEVLEFNRWTKSNQASFIIKDVDIEYDEVRIEGKVVLELNGLEPKEIEFEQIIKTNYREKKVNDFLNRMRGV